MRKLAFALLFACPAVGLAQCRGGSCAPSSPGPVGPLAPAFQPAFPVFQPAAPSVSASAPAWEWRRLEGDPGRLYLFRDGVQVGGLDAEGGYYRPYEAGAWGPKGHVNSEARLVQQQYPPDGVQRDKLDTEERYRCRDNERLSKRQAIAMIQATVPDHQSRQRLTIIGTPDQTRQALADLKAGPLAAWVAEKGVLVQCYEPGDWAVGPDTGFSSDGAPGIYWQDKPNEQGRGRVLYHGRAYAGPDALVAALRRSDPHYDPSKDPNGQPKPPPAPHDPAPAPDQVSVPPGAVGGCCGGLAVLVLSALAFLLRRRDVP